MNKTIISEGKTTTEAIEKGLKELGVSKENVDIKILESENKKSFFSILTPRVVKVEITLKEENNKKDINIPKRQFAQNIEEINEAKENIEIFLKNFLCNIGENLEFSIKIEDYTIIINITGKNAGILIGYRGETLNAMQTIISTIANKKSNDKIRVILDIENYRNKRAKTLEELAEKVAKTVLKNGKSITLEPMSAYERKIIHSKLQNNTKVETHSIGEGENRRVVISKIKNK